MIVPMDEPERGEWTGSVYVVGRLNEGFSGARSTWTHVESRYATGGLPQDLVDLAMSLAETSQTSILRMSLVDGSVETVHVFDNVDDEIIVITGLEEATQ